MFNVCCGCWFIVTVNITSRSTGRMRIQSIHSWRTAVPRSGRSSKPRISCITILIIRMTSGVKLWNDQVKYLIRLSSIQMEFREVPPGSQWSACEAIWRVPGSLRDYPGHWGSDGQHPPPWWQWGGGWWWWDHYHGTSIVTIQDTLSTNPRLYNLFVCYVT